VIVLQAALRPQRRDRAQPRASIAHQHIPHERPNGLAVRFQIVKIRAEISSRIRRRMRGAPGIRLPCAAGPKDDDFAGKTGRRKC
jgi:hypothetical protein